ncbi:MAG: C25 family cysteine peptidase [Pyrinomonadaceae bacterium]
MKRIIALSLIAAFLCAAGAPVNAQRGRTVRDTKGPVADNGNRFASVRAYSDGNGVLIKWEMAAEKNNAGFLIYRLDGSGSALASPEMVLGSAAMYGKRFVAGEKYSFYDIDGTAGSVYFVRSLGMDGTSGNSATAAVEPVSGLELVGSASSTDLNRKIAHSKSNSRLTADRLLLPKTLAAEVSQNQSFADPNTHAWVVAQPGVRIGVKQDGFYRVTKAELQTAGFDVQGDPNLWQLYREGVQQAIIVGPNGDYIDFWGRGLDTQETDTATYFLVSGPSAGKRMATRVARTVSGTVTSPSYSQTFQLKQRINYVSQILNGDAENYWGVPITASVDTTINFNLSGVDLNSQNSVITLRFQGYSAAVSQHGVLITLNGHSLASATGPTRSNFSKQLTIPTSHLQEGANSLVFRANGASNDFVLFDSVNISFARDFLATQGSLKFYTRNYRLSRLKGFPSQNIRVFDMTSESSPILWTNLNIVQEGPTFSVRMPSDRGRSMYAVEDSGLQQAASITLNNPDMLKVSTNSADLLIITHKNWLAEAQNWANYRISQGFTVKVVEVSEVYDEFNYGDLSSLALKNFLQYAKNSWQGSPDYVLLLGDASYDARNYEGLGNNNFVPTHIVNTIYTETGSDDFLADFNGDGLAEIAIGRITARQPQDVTDALAKVTAFETAAPTLQDRGVLFAYDCFDATNNYDFQQYSTNLKNTLPGGTPSTMVGYCDAGPPASPIQLVNAMNTGKLVVNYSGHGTTGSWASAGGFFSNFTVPQLTNAGNQSVFTMLTCLNGYFLHANNVSLAEALVNADNGGAVAAWASTGETTPGEQNAMATRFYQQLGGGSLERLGDLVNDAKSVVAGGSDVRLSWALIGDPMLKVRTGSTGDRPTAVRPTFGESTFIPRGTKQ